MVFETVASSGTGWRSMEYCSFGCQGMKRGGNVGEVRNETATVYREAHKIANFCGVLWRGPILNCGGLGHGRMNAFTTDIDAKELGLRLEKNILPKLELCRAQSIEKNSQLRNRRGHRTSSNSDIVKEYPSHWAGGSAEETRENSFHYALEGGGTVAATHRHNCEFVEP